MYDNLIINVREISQIAVDILNSDALWEKLITETNFTLHNWIGVQNTTIDTRFDVVGRNLKIIAPDAQVWLQPMVDENGHLMIRIQRECPDTFHYQYIYSDGTYAAIADVDETALCYFDYLAIQKAA